MAGAVTVATQLQRLQRLRVRLLPGHSCEGANSLCSALSRRGLTPIKLAYTIYVGRKAGSVNNERL